MYSLSVCHVLFCMILHLQTPVVYMQSLTLTVQTSPLISKHEVKLKCLYSEPTCCTATARVWTRDGTQIMNNGAPSDNTKYAEERNDASHYFDMKILNLEDSDFGKVFQCQYNFLTSNSITLTKGADYEFVPDEYNCTFERKRDGTKMMVGGTFFMKKAAPLPLVYAFYGETNLTIGVSTSMENNFDTWYYRSTFVFKYLVDCLLRNGKSFKVISVTGTSSVELCEKNLCECPKCGLYCWLISLILPVTGVVIFLVVHCIYCCCPQFGEGSACSGRCAILALMLLSLTFSLSTILTLPIGIVVCPCNEGWYQFWNTSWGLLTCHIAIMWIDLSFMKFDWNYLQKNYKTVFVVGIILGNIPLLILSIHDRKSYKGLCDCSFKLCLRSAGIAMLILLILPIPFMIIYFYCLKGGNNRSTKSGSSCWPPCSVGQDPNSPDPENARSLLKKKKADKNTEEKSVAVVRSQPLKARHVMTDNTESTKYSAENEKFSAGLDKGQTPRPLPSIGQPIDSPRPLPQMPRSTQQEKGGIQLQPLGDSTSEKKKKKRRKKKEIKNSDEED